LYLCSSILVEYLLQRGSLMVAPWYTEWAEKLLYCGL